MLAAPSEQSSGHIQELAEHLFSSGEGFFLVSPLSPGLFLKPPVPGLGGWLVPAAGQGLVSPGHASEMMVMHGQPLRSGRLGKAGCFS